MLRRGVYLLERLSGHPGGFDTFELPAGVLIYS
jgi:hypothetical protein